MRSLILNFSLTRPRSNTDLVGEFDEDSASAGTDDFCFAFFGLDLDNVPPQRNGDQSKNVTLTMTTGLTGMSLVEAIVPTDGAFVN